MTDSLVIGGVIELLGGGQPSTHPQAPGAFFRLGTGYDLSAPQMTSEQVAGLLLDGEVVSGFRASNRTPTLPVVIQVLSTGNPQADRATLAGARELLLQTASQDNWELTWTRDGADPLIFDCMGLSAVVVHYSIRTEADALVSMVDVTFQALPYARSDTQEILTFATAAAIWPQPPVAVIIDDFGATTGAVSFLAGDDSTFEATPGDWVNAGGCTVARSTAQAHTGTASLVLTSTGTSNMQAAHVAAASIEAAGMPCNAGDVISVAAYSRAATAARSVNVGADFYDANDVQIGSTLRGSNVTNSTSAFTANPVAAVTAPGGAAWCRANVQVLAPAAAGEVHYFDDVTLNRGAVNSANSPQLWSRSAMAATGSYSARWSRTVRDDPTYDHTLPAPVSITGLTKLAFWFGLGTPSNQWPVWHRGTVSFKITLYDAAGHALTFGVKRACQASALENSPHWQFISAAIPQQPAGFDYTTISRYVIEAWSTWDSRLVQGTAIGATMQATAYICQVQATPTAIGAPSARGALYVLPGITGTARSPLAIQAAPSPSGFSTVTEFTAAGVQNWTAPVGVSSIDKVEVWGAGAGGAGANNQTLGGGGGGGGEYAMALGVAVTPSTIYHPVVGAAGAGGTTFNNGAAGGDSYFPGNTLTVTGHGGRGGLTAPGVWGGGKGGSGSAAYAHYDGGQGYQANADPASSGRGGAGGGSGGRSAPGRHPDDFNAATAVADGGPGGQGGELGAPYPHGGQVPSTGPGGGGGGGANLSGTGGYYPGAAGFAGKVRLTYGATGLLPLQSLLIHSPGRDEPDLFNPLVPVGNGADVPNGATEYPVPDLGNLNARYDGTYTLYLVASSFSTPASSRTLTVQLRQYPYPGGTALTLNVSRTLTPSTDLAGTGQYADMGPVTLPLADIPPGSLSPYFALTVTSGNTADRFLDALLISTSGDLVLLNIGPSTVFQNIWIDQPDSNYDLGRILGSNADRDQAVSALAYAERFSGGPLAVYPDAYNRILAYSAQGAPAITGFYPPMWWTERLI